MKTITIAAAAAIAASIAGAASANAVPSGHASVDAVVNQLEAQGNTVVVNRTGSHPLSQCTVTSTPARPTRATTRATPAHKTTR